MEHGQETGGAMQGQSAPLTDDAFGTSGGEKRLSTQMADNFKDNFATPSADFVIKVEPPWSMEEEPQDQPMSDSTPGSLLSLNGNHVCQRCSATFVLFSSWELHMVTFHGDSLHDLFSIYSAYKWYDFDYHSGNKIDSAVDYNDERAVQGMEENMKGIDSTSTKGVILGPHRGPTAAPGPPPSGYWLEGLCATGNGLLM
ncbi:hypothetical protein ACOMHN_044083 [Nucella lapillus]